MKSITFICETITPMFLNGADGQTPELRPPAIKAALRFWWRALNGHRTLKNLKEVESKLFGSGGEADSGRSRIQIRVIQEPLRVIKSELVPHKPEMKGNAFDTGQTFEVKMQWNANAPLPLNWTEREIQALFTLSCILGGLGKRSRRGMGSVNITKINDNDFLTPTTLDGIFQQLQIVSLNNFNNNGSLISSNFKAHTDFPFVKNIQIGRTDANLLMKISKTTHSVKDKNPQKYGMSLGDAKPRFSSPIYVSTVNSKNGMIPIITTLNTVPPKDSYLVSPELQEIFKNKIL